MVDRLKVCMSSLQCASVSGIYLGSDLGSDLPSKYLRHLGLAFFTSLNHQLFKTIAYVGYFCHYVICSICVFVILYLCICAFVFVYLTVQNIMFDVLGPLAFQKYNTCWVFLALHHRLYLCICEFVFVYLCI